MGLARRIATQREQSQPRLSFRKLTQRAYTFIDLRSTHFVSARIFSPRARVHTLKNTSSALPVGQIARGARRRNTNVAALCDTKPPSNMSLFRRLA